MGDANVIMVVATDDGGEKVITMEDVVCSECGKGTDDELMLLCDGCPDGATHTYCCDPPRDEVPGEDEDWFCKECIRRMLVCGITSLGAKVLTRGAQSRSLSPSQKMIAL